MSGISLATSAASGQGVVDLIGVVRPYWPVLLVALLVALLLTPVMRLLALRNGVVDHPDLSRKVHRKPVAYLGGVAIFLAWMAGVSACYLASPVGLWSGQGGLGSAHVPLSILVGAMAITLTGLFDDVYGISPRVKVGGQLFAAAALASQDVGLRLAEASLTFIGIADAPEILVYTLGTAVIAGFVIGGCNAMNLLDGMDGLAAGVGAIAALGFLVIASIVAVRALGEPGIGPLDAGRIVMCLAILGALIGFLPYNFNPAKIFMGDAGSLLLGYLCVATILLFAQAQGTLLMVTAALIVFALPITDTSLAIFRRKMQGRPIMSPDNGHLHHLLQRSGMSVRQTVLCLYGLGLVFASLGVTLVLLEARVRYVMALFVVLYLAIIIVAYRYGQALAAREADARRNEPAAAAPAEPVEPAVTSGSGKAV